MNLYLFCIKAKLDGPYIDSWHKIDKENKQETRAVLFALNFRSVSRMNDIGVCLIHAEEEWTAELLQNYLRSMSNIKSKEFLLSCKIGKEHDI